MKTFLTLILSTQIAFAQDESAYTLDEDDFTPQELKPYTAPKLSTLAEATEWADLVALVQVDDIEYNKARELNSSGFAYLNVLIPYKGSSYDEPIVVIAYGVEDDVCYFPDRENEGQRFLTFLKKAPGPKSNVYYGFKPFCQMQILLSETGQYHLRYPLNNKGLKIDESLVKNVTYNEPHAFIDSTLWTGTQREKYSNEFQTEIIEDESRFNKTFHLRYTKGIHISDVRPLLKLKYKPRITSNQF